MLISESIQLSKTKHTLIAPHIIRIDGKEGEYIELEDAVKMREANLELTNGEPFCLIMNGVNSYYTYSPEVKKLFAGEEYCKLRKATAFVINSLSTRLMASFYININKPLTPTQIFSSEEEAINWLKSIKIK